MFAGKKSAQIREILISESAWEEMTCLFAPSLNQRVGKFTPLFEFLYSYVYTLVRNNNFKIYVSGQAHGSAQANISSNDILQYPVVKPNDALLRAFDVVVRNLISLKLKNQAQIQSLEQLRDTLLPKLLSGEITLPEAEQAVSEVENV
ncbi:TPA: hypothetical protein KML63_004437 [Escherichia coli]|nr:hypothetical protein [Escherichia coli]